MIKKYSSIKRIIEVSDWKENDRQLKVSKRLKVCIANFKQVMKEYE